MIEYAVTYEVITPESAEYGEAEGRGFIQEEAEDDFEEMVKLLEHTQPSSWPIHAYKGLWFTHYCFNEGTAEYYETGNQENRSYHPKTEEDAKKMVEAWKVTNE